MKFIDRTREVKRMESWIKSAESRLMVLYGRRRIGKSTLIKKVLTSHTDAIYYQADETQVANQLNLIAKVIGQTIPGFDKVTYPDWYTLLEAFNYRVKEGTIFCLDEFPYLVKSFPALPSVIQNYIDNGQPKFKLILCGSSQQSMYSDILSESSPLYGRAELIMKLQPIPAGYIMEAMDIDSPEVAIANYSVWGGIPRYWKMSLEYDSLEESIKELLLRPDGTLAEEPTRLLRDEMRDMTVSRTVLSVIGDGANRMSEIAARVGKPVSELTGPVKRLIDMGYIEKEVPFAESTRNSKKTLYKIKDQFLSAYFNFVAPNASLISFGRPETVWRMVSPQISHFIGNSWESLCRNAVSGNEIDGRIYGEARRWWGSIPNKTLKKNEMLEIDVMAESVDGQTLLIGECKWTHNENVRRIFDNLVEKSRKLPFIDNYANVEYVLFLKEPPSVVSDLRCLYPSDILNMLKQ